ncbi:Zinc finger BED domain-containing protein 6, partial [Frankliniella fusca]
MAYEELRSKFAVKIAAVQSLTLTADIWTSQAMKSHSGVTCHSPKGNDMISVELCAKPLDTRCTIAHLRTALRDVCTAWGIKDEAIIAFVTDGGASIKGAVRGEFGVLKHVTCFAHLLNGIDQAAIGLHTTTVPSEAGAELREVPDNEEDLDDDGDDIQADGSGSLQDLVIRVKKIVRFVRTSTVTTAELLSLRKEKGTPEHKCLKLMQEVRTRWSSAFEMLERFLQLADDDIFAPAISSLHPELTAVAVETPPESIWSEFDQRVRDSAVDASQDAAGGLPIEFRQYLNRPACSRRENLFVLWDQLKAEYLHVYKVAM